MQTPTIGRIVHYTTKHGTHAALVTATYPDGSVGLRVFGRPATGYTPHDFDRVAFEGEPGEVGKWTWPPRGDKADLLAAVSAI